ncbi:alpha/beta fold hydrolase [Thalassobacillus sp. C254]|uniref:alpha/beta fold hydrolase n=1 Tax=Thalassobacillus sp. C254 TaxID=1225341 RepID=UPI0009F83B59|nr:alpha/beta hydrolase [Thalassobacillus sp. C254]
MAPRSKWWRMESFLRGVIQHFEVIAPDHPGFNDSDVCKHMDSVEDMAFHYRDFLDLLEIESVSICASSLGAWIGLQFALTHQHRVKKLVVSNVAGINIPGVESIDPFSMTIHDLSQRLFYDKSKAPQMPPLDSMPIEMLKNRSMHARLMWEKGYDPKLLSRAEGLHVPTLIIWGENDELIPVENGEKLDAALPNSKLVVFEETGHLPYIEKREELLKEISKFI